MLKCSIDGHCCPIRFVLVMVDVFFVLKIRWLVVEPDSISKQSKRRAFLPNLGVDFSKRIVRLEFSYPLQSRID
jgi:hypothetical protein